MVLREFHGSFKYEGSAFVTVHDLIILAESLKSNEFFLVVVTKILYGCVFSELNQSFVSLGNMKLVAGRLEQQVILSYNPEEIRQHLHALLSINSVKSLIRINTKVRSIFISH